MNWNRGRSWCHLLSRVWWIASRSSNIHWTLWSLDYLILRGWNTHLSLSSHWCTSCIRCRDWDDCSCLLTSWALNIAVYCGTLASWLYIVRLGNGLTVCTYNHLPLTRCISSSCCLVLCLRILIICRHYWYSLIWRIQGTLRISCYCLLIAIRSLIVIDDWLLYRLINLDNFILSLSITGRLRFPRKWSWWIIIFLIFQSLLLGQTNFLLGYL